MYSDKEDSENDSSSNEEEEEEEEGEKNEEEEDEDGKKENADDSDPDDSGGGVQDEFDKNKNYKNKAFYTDHKPQQMKSLYFQKKEAILFKDLQHCLASRPDLDRAETLIEIFSVARPYYKESEKADQPWHQQLGLNEQFYNNEEQETVGEDTITVYFKTQDYHKGVYKALYQYMKQKKNTTRKISSSSMETELKNEDGEDDDCGSGDDRGSESESESEISSDDSSDDEYLELV